MSKNIASIFISALCTTSIYAMPVDRIAGDYLVKPTGEYHVGYKDYHWINGQSCPDPFYKQGRNENDFSEENVNHCREITARVYYPTNSSELTGNHYFQPVVDDMKSMLKKAPEVTEKDLSEIDNIKTYSSANQPIVADKQFPVILFSPGYTMAAQEYENTITDLVSHGYIVVGFNSSFIDIAQLPNGHVIKPLETMNIWLVENKYVPAQIQDLKFVNNIVNSNHNSDEIFRAMDVKKIGALGHSLGARMIADALHKDPNLLTAAATLDVGLDTTGNSQKKFSIPFMHAISSNRISADPFPVHFELGNDGYLVGMSPSEDNHDFSKHLNYSDLSTLQYIPAFAKAMPYLKKHVGDILGTGDGNEINQNINTYVRTFFDMYLKAEPNASLKSCKTITGDSYMKCG